MYQRPMFYNNVRPNNRFIGGGFLGPFILGGITGGLVAPAFYPRPYNNYYYNNYPRPYNNYYYNNYYYPYPYYRPY